MTFRVLPIIATTAACLLGPAHAASAGPCSDGIAELGRKLAQSPSLGPVTTGTWPCNDRHPSRVRPSRRARWQTAAQRRPGHRNLRRQPRGRHRRHDGDECGVRADRHLPGRYAPAAAGLADRGGRISGQVEPLGRDCAGPDPGPGRQRCRPSRRPHVPGQDGTGAGAYAGPARRCPVPRRAGQGAPVGRLRREAGLAGTRSSPPGIAVPAWSGHSS